MNTPHKEKCKGDRRHEDGLCHCYDKPTHEEKEVTKKVAEMMSGVQTSPTPPSTNEEKEWDRELYEVCGKGELYLNVRMLVNRRLHSQATQIQEEIEEGRVEALKDTYPGPWKSDLRTEFVAGLSHAKEVVGRYLPKK